MWCKPTRRHDRENKHKQQTHKHKKIEVMKQTANGTTAAQVREQEEEKRRSFFHVFRDVYTINEKTGLQTKHARREWLHLTPAGRYVWGDHDRATDIRFSDSCRIVENLQTHGNGYRFNYGKIWQY